MSEEPLIEYRTLSDVEIRHRMTYHPPVGDQVARHQGVAEVIEAALRGIDALVPASREKSVAFTHLETAKMWASAGIARNLHPSDLIDETYPAGPAGAGSESRER